MICLGPMGNPDPTDLINLETNRIPFKISNMNLDWSQAFRSWPSSTPGWRNWFHRMVAPHQTNWDNYDIGQCITLSLSEMIRNEPMLISASYFWSDALNAFLFGHGPRKPTLLDVLMLISLNILAPDRSHDLLAKASSRFKTRNIGGWKGYIERYSKSGAADHREHIAFINMWLEKYIFCGKIVGPTSNTLKVAETLAEGNMIPLGKHLLGSVYYLLHQVSAKLRTNQPISNLGGPWWFIQLWLNMYMHKTMGINLRQMSFPSENFAEGARPQTRRCTSFGEATSMIANDPQAFGVTDFFRCFYMAFVKNPPFGSPTLMKITALKTQ